MDNRSSRRRRLTRRHVLKSGATALGGGAALLTGCRPRRARRAGPGRAHGHADRPHVPRDSSATSTRSTFRRCACCRPIRGRWSSAPRPSRRATRSCAARSSTNPIRRAEVPNHCGFGVVEAVGAMVKRVQVGDRVVVAGTSQCGQCYQCLQGRPDYCQFTFFSNAPGVEPFPPFARDARRHARVRAGGHRRHERDHDGVRGVLRAGLHRPAGRAAHAARRSAGVGLRRRPRRHALPAGLATWSSSAPGPVGLGAVQAGRVTGRGPGHRRSIRSSTAASSR